MRVVAKGHIVLSRRLNGAFYDEKCPCPSDLDTFYSDYKCPESFDQLDADMAKFPGTFVNRSKNLGFEFSKKSR